MEIKDTIEMMTSEDYKERFKAEYYQLKIRTEKLAAIVLNYEEGTLNFEPKCSLGILQNQLDAMERYLAILKSRAKIEKVDI
jgi:hypothetical protein